MSKPIFIVRLPQDFEFDKYQEIQKSLKRYLKEYYVLSVVSDIAEPKFELFNCVDMPEINFKELEELILSYKK